MVKFRMYGRIIQLLRWSVEYTEIIPTDDSKTEEYSRTEYFIGEDEADKCAKRTGGVKTAIEVAPEDEWLDGLEVEDVPDTYARATEIIQMGEAAYNAAANAPTVEEYLIDLDYRQSKIELGLN